LVLTRGRDSKYTTAFDTVLADSGITTVTTGIHVPRMNAIMERWIRTCRTERLDRTLIWNQPTYDTPYASTSRTTTNTGPTAHSTLRHYSARYRNKPGL
jgi:transposase InsO family protein